MEQLQTTDQEVVLAELPATEQESIDGEQELQVSVTEFGKKASGIIVKTEDDFKNAAEFVKEIKKKANAVKTFFEPLKKSAYAAHQQVCSREKEMLAPLVSAEKEIKSAMAVWTEEKERERRAAEETARKAAQEQADRLLQESIELEKTGNTVAAEQKFNSAAMLEKQSGQIVIPVEKTQVSGVSQTKDWEITAVDETAVPVELNGMCIRPVDERAVLKLIKESKGKIKIPGIEYKETTKFSIRS